MRYIAHHRYKGLGLFRDRLNIPYGTELEVVDDFLIMPQEGKIVCYLTSENAKRYFARNDDGLGLERGKLTHAIAYSKRDAGNGFRFSDREAKILMRDWSHFLRQDLDVILFNDSFFNADPEELRKLTAALNIKVRR